MRIEGLEEGKKERKGKEKRGVYVLSRRWKRVSESGVRVSCVRMFCLCESFFFLFCDDGGGADGGVWSVEWTEYKK